MNTIEYPDGSIDKNTQSDGPLTTALMDDPVHTMDDSTIYMGGMTTVNNNYRAKAKILKPSNRAKIDKPSGS